MKPREILVGQVANKVDLKAFMESNDFRYLYHSHKIMWYGCNRHADCACRRRVKDNGNELVVFETGSHNIVNATPAVREYVMTEMSDVQDYARNCVKDYLN
jgi:hypothetical protein